jgi:hypothetical protein
MSDAAAPGRPDLAILVNSTDRYADTWAPFFTLFAAYWPGCPYEIVLNTETLDYRHPGLDIRVSRTWPDPAAPRPDWSESLSRCLAGIDAAVILYLQDDYFLNGPVDVEAVEQFARILEQGARPHVLLRELTGSRHYEPLPDHAQLWRIPARSPYLVSLQAGLWRREALQGLLRSGESPWQFERWGTIRARRAGLEFLCPNLDRYEWAGRPVIPYEPTGIVGGRWYAPAVVELFDRHGIRVDFSGRGFYRVDRRERIVRGIRANLRRLAMRITP